MKQKRLSSISAADRRLGYAFLLPGMLFITVFVLIPIGYSIYMSLFEWTIYDLGKERTFVFLNNFAKIFQDKVFHAVLLNTFLLVGICLALEMGIGFFISIALWNIKRSLKAVHAVIIMPMIMAPVVVSLIWRFIYDPLYGMLNYILNKTLGMSGLAWLGDANLALGSIIAVDVWQRTSFVILVLYAGLTAVPMENVEAALIDGASYWKAIRHVVLPFILPLVFLAIMIRSMDLIRIFDIVYLLTRGGPSASTEMLSTYVYRVGFSNFEMGYATALSIITMVIILAISLVFVRGMNRKGDK